MHQSCQSPGVWVPARKLWRIHTTLSGPPHGTAEPLRCSSAESEAAAALGKGVKDVFRKKNRTHTHTYTHTHVLTKTQWTQGHPTAQLSHCGAHLQNQGQQQLWAKEQQMRFGRKIEHTHTHTHTCSQRHSGLRAMPRHS